MDELEEIRKRKMLELRQQYSQQASQEAYDESQAQQQLRQIEAVVRQRMTKEALSRFSNIKAADPDKASQIMVLLAQLLQTGRLTMIDDNILKDILTRISGRKREMKIRRV